MTTDGGEPGSSFCGRHELGRRSWVPAEVNAMGSGDNWRSAARDWRSDRLVGTFEQLRTGQR
ncbi:hypothetical protein OROHE_017398 [Orobanche hederae]